ncbi:aldo/keto reductase [Pseudomonas putida]|uniref:aldo/keto reductase n=1 Tax=Pseudomonas putida TaxID=303 RepID=UPI00335BC329
MRYRRLGNTSLDVSVVGIGTWQYSGEWGEVFEQRRVDEILDAAGEEGVNFIDTAECYGDHVSERLIGDYLARRDKKNWIVASKFGHHFQASFDRSPRWQPRQVLEQLEASLRSLRCERIDLYQFHSGSNDVFFQDELWQMLNDQKKAGKIGHLGISIAKQGNSEQVRAARSLGIEVIQLVYNRLQRDAEENELLTAQSDGLGVLARVPLASGYLSGKYKPGVVFAADDIRRDHDMLSRDIWLKQVEHIQQYEVPEGVPIAQWALAWCLRRPAVTTVIPGAKSAQQARDNARAATLLDLEIV